MLHTPWPKRSVPFWTSTRERQYPVCTRRHDVADTRRTNGHHCADFVSGVHTDGTASANAGEASNHSATDDHAATANLTETAWSAAASNGTEAADIGAISTDDHFTGLHPFAFGIGETAPRRDLASEPGATSANDRSHRARGSTTTGTAAQRAGRVDRAHSDETGG